MEEIEPQKAGELYDEVSIIHWRIEKAKSKVLHTIDTEPLRGDIESFFDALIEETRSLQELILLTAYQQTKLVCVDELPTKVKTKEKTKKLRNVELNTTNVRNLLIQINILYEKIS